MIPYYRLDYKPCNANDSRLNRYMTAKIIPVRTMRPGKTKRDKANKERRENG